jgi:hypothetical protein
MKDNYREFYQLRCQSYLSDGIYIWEDVDAECATLDECLDCMVHAQCSPEYTDFEIEFRQVTVLGPSGYKGDN